MASLHLSTELSPEHIGGVQGLLVISNDYIVAGSDDHVVTVWKREGEGASFFLLHTCEDHTGMLRCIAEIPACASFPTGGFVTGCLDTKIRLYMFDPSNGALSLLHTLTGHTKGVISLSWTSSGDLISGGWEGEARVWDISTGRCKQTLTGHENGTCVLGLPNGDIVVGSTGRKDERNQHVDYKIRVWKQQAGGVWAVKAVIEDHEQAVRDLALLADGAGYVSAGNDGAVKLRDLSGRCFMTFSNPVTSEGKPFSAFRVRVCPSGDILSCNEDCVVRVYSWAAIQGATAAVAAAAAARNGAPASIPTEEIVHPGQPWCAGAFPNGDIVTAGAQAGTSRRGHVYVWTRSSTRRCDEAALAKLAADLEPPPKAADGPTGGSGLPDGFTVQGPYESRASARGSRDGMYGFFSKADGSVMACAWVAERGEWEDVGVLSEGPGGGGGGGQPTQSGGRRYDYNLSVTMDTGSGTKAMTLRFDDGDDANTVARSFMTEQGLYEDAFEEVRNFVLTHQSQRDAGRRSVAAALPQFSSFPPPALIVLDSVPDMRKLTSKLRELNDTTVACSAQPAVAGLGLSASEADALSALGAQLAETSRWHASDISRATVAGVLVRKLLRWPTAAVFPALDLLRVLVCHPDGAAALAEVDGPEFVVRETARIAALAEATGEAAIAAARLPSLLSARALVNALKHEPTRHLMLGGAPLVFNAISDLLESPHPTVVNAGAMLLHNYAFLLCLQHRAAAGSAAVLNPQALGGGVAGSSSSSSGSGGGAGGSPTAQSTAGLGEQMLGLLVEGFHAAKEEGTVLLLLCALGTLALIGHSAAAKRLALEDTVSSLRERFAASPAVSTAALEVGGALALR